MYQYSVIQWLFFFYFYCFFGWCFESAYVSLKSRKLTNRGFMRGPFLPLYGSGGIMMLLVSAPFRDNIFLTYVAGCVGATVLEYVTGVTMEALFKVRYWDYSKVPLNFQGHICLGSSLAWGGLTILMTQVIHTPIEQLVLSIPSQALTAVTLLLTAGIFADFALSFKAAIDLRNVLMRMEQVKTELVHIQKRLDVIIALTSEGVSNRKEELTGGVAELTAAIEEKLENIKALALAKPTEYLENVREEVLELKTKFAVTLELQRRLSGLRDFFQRSLIRSNPTMTSVRFREALEELKKRVSVGKENGKDESGTKDVSEKGSEKNF